MAKLNLESMSFDEIMSLPIDPVPVFIQFNDEFWINNDIQDELDWAMSPDINLRVAFENLYRAEYKSDDGQTAIIICHSPSLTSGRIDEEDFFMLSEECLQGDAWGPNGEQFCFSDFGWNMNQSMRDGKFTMTRFDSNVVIVEEDENTFSWADVGD